MGPWCAPGRDDHEVSHDDHEEVALLSPPPADTAANTAMMTKVEATACTVRPPASRMYCA